MNYTTTQAHEELRAKVRAFVEAEVKPIAFKLDQESRFPKEAVAKMGELGLMGLPYEKEYEGAGLDVLSYVTAPGPFTKNTSRHAYNRNDRS